MAKRMCFALDLIDDAALIEEYERAHTPGSVWPEVTRGIHAAGYLSMEIWRVADRLFMVTEVADDWPRVEPAPLELADKSWQLAMDRFQRQLSHAGEDEKWIPMKRIY